MSPYSVCVCWLLLCLSFFIFDAFSVPTAGRGDSSSMPSPALSDLLHPSLSLPLTFCCHLSHLNFILFTTSDNTPVSFSFVLVSFPLPSLFCHLFPPSTPQFGRQNHSEKDSLGKKFELIHHIMFLLYTKHFIVQFNLVIKHLTRSVLSANVSTSVLCQTKKKKLTQLTWLVTTHVKIIHSHISNSHYSHL